MVGREDGADEVSESDGQDLSDKDGEGNGESEFLDGCRTIMGRESFGLCVGSK